MSRSSLVPESDTTDLRILSSTKFILGPGGGEVQDRTPPRVHPWLWSYLSLIVSHDQNILEINQKFLVFLHNWNLRMTSWIRKKKMFSNYKTELSYKLTVKRVNQYHVYSQPKELSFCGKLWIFNHFIFGTQCRRP